MPPTSYHNHTRFSDGRGTVAETVAAAARIGLGEVGISDHLWLDPDDAALPPWSLDPARLEEYVTEVREASRPEGPIVRVGIELDWLPRAAPLIERTITEHAFDYVIGSVHYVGDFGVDASPARWEKLSASERDDMHRRYWLEARACAESGLFDVFGHIDLPKKFGFLPDADLSGVIEPALDAVAASGMTVEINTAGWHKACRDAYPTSAILSLCHAREIPVTISADAHRVDHLARDFIRAARRLSDAGYEEVAMFAGRERTMQPIDDAVRGLIVSPADPTLDDF